MLVKLSAAVRGDHAQALITRLDAGSGLGTLRLYTAPQPASAGEPISTQTLLGTLTLSDPCGTHAGGVLTLGAIAPEPAAPAGGVAAWARLSDSDGNAVIDLDVSSSGGGGAIQLNTTTIVAGGPIVMTEAVITMGGA